MTQPSPNHSVKQELVSLGQAVKELHLAKFRHKRRLQITQRLTVVILVELNVTSTTSL